MLSVFLFLLSLASVVSAFFSGKLASLTPALFEGAEAGITLVLHLAGPICLWSGVSEVFLRSGVSRLITKVIHPLITLFIRPRSTEAPLLASLSENISSNLLGIGNAATPAGLRAAGMLESAGDDSAAARLTLLNASSIQLIPLTAAAMRASHGAERPMDILPGVLFASFFSLMAAFLTFRLLSRRG